MFADTTESVTTQTILAPFPNVATKTFSFSLVKQFMLSTEGAIRNPFKHSTFNRKPLLNARDHPQGQLFSPGKNPIVHLCNSKGRNNNSIHAITVHRQIDWRARTCFLYKRNMLRMRDMGPNFMEARLLVQQRDKLAPEIPMRVSDLFVALLNHPWKSTA